MRERLGLGAHLVALRRTAVGDFKVEGASTLAELEALPAEKRGSARSWIPLADIPLPLPAVVD